MDYKTWVEIQEKIAFILTFFGPFLGWFAGKFIYNRWEKRKLEAQAQQDETDAKKKEAELLVIYEGIARRASEESISKSDRWRKIEEEWNKRFDEMEKEIDALRSENSRLKLEVETLQKDKVESDRENTKLRERIAVLEKKETK